MIPLFVSTILAGVGMLPVSFSAVGDAADATSAVVYDDGEYSWRTRSDRPQELYLYHRGKQIGAWDHAGGCYRRYIAASNSYDEIRYASAPIGLPNSPEPVRNFGLDLGKIRAGVGGEYTRNGVRVSREEALKLVGDDIPHDHDCMRLTWVGDAATGERIRQDLATLDTWRDRVTYQSYASADLPILRGLGFETGKLHLQSPNGRMLHCQLGYTTVAALTDVLQAAELRRRDPNYDPSRVPDLSKKPLLKPQPAPDEGGITIPPLKEIPPWVWAILGWLVSVLTRKKE